MRLEWLEDILAVTEAGSFTEAAQRRHLTQSAFSRRIRTIEAALGVELFDRSRKPVRLRPAIDEQKDRIAGLIVALRQLSTDLRLGERASANRIVIVSQHALTASLAPAIVSRLGALTEGIHVRLRSGNLDECFAMLLSRQADIALVYRLPGEEHPFTTDYIETAVIGADRLVPVAAAAGRDETIARIARGVLHYIAYPGDVFFGQVMNRSVLAGLAGTLQVNARAETALTLAALAMAAAGTAVAWVPASLAAGQLREGKLADLSAHLPGSPLEMTAVRLLRDCGPVGDRVWACITEVPPAQDG